jgi:hypothetical protein
VKYVTKDAAALREVALFKEMGRHEHIVQFFGCFDYGYDFKGTFQSFFFILNS